MSISDSSGDTAQRPGSDAAERKFFNLQEQKMNAEKITKCEMLRTYFEAGFIAIMEDLMKKCGQPFTDYLKVLLECSICKGLINKAVSRRCSHTFCSGCLTEWIGSSDDCPICRDNIIMHVKNPIIDKLVNLLVDITFTKKEKGERSNEIQQLTADKPLRFMESISENLQGGVVIQEAHPDTSIPGKMSCVMVAHLLLSEMRSQFPLADDFQNIPDILLVLHIEMYNSDLESFRSVYKSIPKSVLHASFFE